MEKCKVIEYLEGSLSDGGAETLVKDYCLLLDKSSFEPVVLVDWIFRDSANYRRLAGSGVRMVSLYPRYSIFWRAVNRFFRESYLNFRLGQVLEKERPDVLHIHLAALHRVAANQRHLKDVRLVYTCHNEPRFYFDGEMAYEDRAARKLITENGLRLIGLHPDMARELNGRFGVDNTVFIRNGIRMSAFRNVKMGRDEKRKEMGIPLSSFVAIHIGRFVAQKNHSFLLDVFDAMVKRHDDCFLVLVGDGEGETQVREKIHALGLDGKVMIISNRTDIAELLSMSDVFLFPSLFEGLGIALIEAQAVGIHSISSDSVPQEAFVSNLVIPMSLNASPEQWAEKALDKSIRSTYRNRLDEYDMEKEIRKLEKVYTGEI